MPSSIGRSAGTPETKRCKTRDFGSPKCTLAAVTGLTKIVRPDVSTVHHPKYAPISNVAATIPKISAARNIALLFSSLMTNSVRSLGFSLLAGIGAAALIGCSETTAPVRRYPVLDDVGAEPVGDGLRRD